jgi:hypothetical protein
MEHEYHEGPEALESFKRGMKVNMKLNYLETHLAKHKYVEGHQATKNFEALARTVFQAKKTVAQVAPKKAVRREPSGKDKA